MIDGRKNVNRYRNLDRFFTDSQMVKLVYRYKNDDGLSEKRGVILKVRPEDLPIVPEAEKYPQYYLGYLVRLSDGY